MKKYLMTSAAAIAMIGAMTSCSHDDQPGQYSELQSSYIQAFNATFGVPAANQDWGFGEPAAAASRMTRALGDYDDYKGSMKPVEWYQDTEDGWKWKTRTYTFPSDCDASKFLADVPAGIDMLVNAGKVNAYIDETYTGSVNIWGAYEDGKTQGGTLYVKGNNDFSSRSFYVAPNTDVYLVEGATLTLKDEDASTIKYNLYIAPGAKLIASGTTGRVKLDNGAQVYNHGNIECKTFEVNNTSMLYNGSVGKLTTTGEVYVANANSIIVNDGEITSGTANSKTGSLQTAGSGRVENNAEWTVYGETIINSNYNIWVNNGHFTTENYTYTAGSSSVINNCFLTVNENFTMNTGDGNADFKIDTGGGVLTKNFYGGGAPNSNTTFTGGPFKIVMGSKSLFKVTNEAHMNALGSAIYTAHYGFDGVGIEYAVLEAKKILKDGTGHGNVAYSGNLYVSTEEHFAQGKSGEYPYIHFYDGCTAKNIYAPGFESGKPNITIETTPCNPGFNGGNGGNGGGGNINPVINYDVRIIAEDLTAKQGSDFDFNDVVFDVHYTSGTTATITLLAAGGTLPITVAGRDVHQLFNAQVNEMINTNTAGTKEFPGVTRDPVSFDITGIDQTQRGRDIQIMVQKDNKWEELIANQGVAAAKIAVKQSFQWCDEYVNITTVYPLFKDYVQNPDVIWY